ncbi:MAG: hypothetical protein M1825_001239 [Sarcosagium campestre]|nr:MAG: hypothetical protein M1825_001239 [Sarcosagium campestre]
MDPATDASGTIDIDKGIPPPQPASRDVSGPLFTPAERIQQLNVIDKDITGLLRSAGLAVKALTNNAAPSSSLPSSISPSQDPVTVETQKTAFTEASSDYFHLLDAVSVHLRRQIYALEEADIIAAEAAPKDTKSTISAALAAMAGAGSTSGAAAAPQMSSERTATTAGPSGGLGNLDVDWLNGRSYAVGREMELELWKKARSFLEEVENSKRESDVIMGDTH